MAATSLPAQTVTRLSSAAQQRVHYRIECAACGFALEVMQHGEAPDGSPGDAACLAATWREFRAAHPSCAPWAPPR